MELLRDIKIVLLEMKTLSAVHFLGVPSVVIHNRLDCYFFLHFPLQSVVWSWMLQKSGVEKRGFVMRNAVGIIERWIQRQLQQIGNHND
jgi:hypothetical protein